MKFRQDTEARRDELSYVLPHKPGGNKAREWALAFAEVCEASFLLDPGAVLNPAPTFDRVFRETGDRFDVGYFAQGYANTILADVWYYGEAYASWLAGQPGQVRLDATVQGEDPRHFFGAS